MRKWSKLSDPHRRPLFVINRAQSRSCILFHYGPPLHPTPAHRCAPYSSNYVCVLCSVHTKCSSSLPGWFLNLKSSYILYIFKHMQCPAFRQPISTVQYSIHTSLCALHVGSLTSTVLCMWATLHKHSSACGQHYINSALHVGSLTSTVLCVWTTLR